MKIYFSGPINGGIEDQEPYYDMVLYCKNFGHVLTDNIKDNEYEKTTKEERYSDNAKEHIYLRATDRIRRGDVIIADVTIPSLGVGYEIAYAESLNKRILCLNNTSVREKTSFIISGNSSIVMKEYKTIEEAKERIKEYFEEEGLI